MDSSARSRDPAWLMARRLSILDFVQIKMPKHSTSCVKDDAKYTVNEREY